MVNYPVAKIGRENFPFNRLVQNKDYAWAWFILPPLNFIGKPKQVVFIVNLELQLVPGISFVLACPVVGFKQLDC